MTEFDDMSLKKLREFAERLGRDAKELRSIKACLVVNCRSEHALGKLDIKYEEHKSVHDNMLWALDRLVNRIAEQAEEIKSLREQNNLILCSLKWDGDGYAWNPPTVDFRLNPSEAVAKMEREQKAQAEELERLRQQVENLESYRKKPSVWEKSAKIGFEEVENLETKLAAAEQQITDAYDAIFQDVPEGVDDEGKELSVADKIGILSNLRGIAESRVKFSEHYRPQIAALLGLGEHTHWGDICVILESRMKKYQAAEKRVGELESEGSVYCPACGKIRV